MRSTSRFSFKEHRIHQVPLVGILDHLHNQLYNNQFHIDQFNYIHFNNINIHIVHRSIEKYG